MGFAYTEVLAMHISIFHFFILDLKEVRVYKTNSGYIVILPKAEPMHKSH